MVHAAAVSWVRPQLLAVGVLNTNVPYRVVLGMCVRTYANGELLGCGLRPQLLAVGVLHTNFQYYLSCAPVVVQYVSTHIMPISFCATPRLRATHFLGGPSCFLITTFDSRKQHKEVVDVVYR